MDNERVKTMLEDIWHDISKIKTKPTKYDLTQMENLMISIHEMLMCSDLDSSVVQHYVDELLDAVANFRDKARRNFITAYDFALKTVYESLDAYNRKCVESNREFLTFTHLDYVALAAEKPRIIRVVLPYEFNNICCDVPVSLLNTYGKSASEVIVNYAPTYYRMREE